MLLVVLAAIDGRLWDAGGPGIVGFELAGSEERSQDIVAEWGDELDAARLSLWLDYAYMAAYGVFWTLAVAATRDMSAGQGWRRFASAGRVLVPFPLLGAGFDAIENVGLLLALDGNGGAFAPRLGAIAASLKFLFTGVATGYVALVLLRRAWAHWPRAVPLAIAGLAAAGVALLALNAWALERQTEPADPDVGRVLELPGGDLQVREDGDPRDPALLLIHGYTASMRWWDGVVPALARDHRVIRVDLLGHGGSEKPRDGYSMEQQADLVAQAMRRLGIRRAAVVGHSMGGAVATALAERHRGRVSRVMVIGTPPGKGNWDPDIGERLAYLPLSGQAIKRAVPADLVRARIEETFIRGYDPPRRLARDTVDRTTWNSFYDSAIDSSDYVDEKPLSERLADEHVPLTVLFGTEDDQVDQVDGYGTVPGARIIQLRGLGHSPFLERPRRVIPLLRAFAGPGRGE